MSQRIIVVALARNARGDYLICKMPPDRGVFPGQWGLPGGGLEDGERLEDALRREMKEEVGLEISHVYPLFFDEDVRDKTFPDGRREEVHMIYLLFECWARGDRVRLNAELEEHAWVSPSQLAKYDLNDATRDTFRKLGFLGADRPAGA